MSFTLLTLSLLLIRYQSSESPYIFTSGLLYQWWLLSETTIFLSPSIVATKGCFDPKFQTKTCKLAGCSSRWPPLHFNEEASQKTLNVSRSWLEWNCLKQELGMVKRVKNNFQDRDIERCWLIPLNETNEYSSSWQDLIIHK